MNTPGQRIRAKRKELGYRQNKFAAMVGMAQSTLSEIERGESNMPSAENLKKISVALNVSESWIMYGKDGDLCYPTREESEILSELRKLSVEQKMAVYAIVKGLIKE